MEYKITPMAKPRMTRSDAWRNPPRPIVARYWKFKSWCVLEKVALPCYGSHVTFVLPMPDSWSEKKKKQFDGQPHTQSVDLDNLLKGLCDAIYGNDSVIYDIHVTKRWGREGKIIIEDEICNHTSDFGR